jgi:hypothetical protein
MKRLRRTWRSGLPPFRPVPPVLPPVAGSVPAARDGAEMERLAEPDDLPGDGWTTGQLAAIYPGAGEGWDARNLPREGKRF